MNRKFQIAFSVQGALGADLAITFTVPSDCQLVHVSAVASNDSDALLTIGDSDDADEYLASTVIGDSDVPKEFDGADFLDTAGDAHGRYYPRIVDGTVVAIALDYDGASGTAAEDFTIVLTFAEG